ncbi:hypothetical protein [Synechococcus sp. MEDNS5]|uniref:hypothetical protein n=1 Tax=Synechococcus sp. MEDNS5 TaxID=1442554 RepID=UPI001647108B|nr:hypothetical protein [Synechococcus sp. MEDNS5]
MFPTLLRCHAAKKRKPSQGLVKASKFMISKAVATRVAKNASAMSVTVAQYNQLSYQRRSWLRMLESPLQLAIEKSWLPSPE